MQLLLNSLEFKYSCFPYICAFYYNLMKMGNFEAIESSDILIKK